jgi:hypothetical protein
VLKRDSSTSSAIPKSGNTMRTPVYFLSHGGVSLLSLFSGGWGMVRLTGCYSRISCMSETTPHIVN